MTLLHLFGRLSKLDDKIGLMSFLCRRKRSLCYVCGWHESRMNERFNVLIGSVPGAGADEKDSDSDYSQGGERGDDDEDSDDGDHPMPSK